MSNYAGSYLLLEAALFVVTMILITGKSTKLLGEYSGIAFHLFLLLPIFGIRCALAGQAAGCVWVACDVIAGVGSLWSRPDTLHLQAGVFKPIRMAGHIFAALWIVALSLTLPVPGMVTGLLLAAGFAGYTLAGGRLSEKALAGPGLLMVVWLVLLARRVQ
jgi:hypothetical protein